MSDLQASMNKITISKDTQFNLDTGIQGYPSFTFAFKIDCKADIPLEIVSIISHVYMSSAFMGKIYWTFHEKLIDKNYQIEVIEPLGSTWVNLRFSAPKDFLKSKHPRHWELRGVINFGSGEVFTHKKFNIKFTLEEWIYEKTVSTYFE